MSHDVTGSVSLFGPPNVEVETDTQNITNSSPEDGVNVQTETTQVNVAVGGTTELTVESTIPPGTPAIPVEDLTLAYDLVTGDLLTVTGDTSGDVITLVWLPDGTLTQVLDGFTGTTLDFTYDTDGDLTNITFS